MKKKTTIILLLFACLNLSGQSKKELRALAKYITGMQPIQTDDYYQRIPSYDYKASELDSLLILTYYPLRVNVENFMISDHEVTNFEYRQFVRWVKDSIASQTNKQDKIDGDLVYNYTNNSGVVMNVKVLPDTSLWQTEKEYSYNEAYVLHYFRHEIYNEYPVVGVSYVQANAYIHWLNKRLQIFLEEHNFKSNICSYSLPSEIEWQYAANGNPSNLSGLNENIYPWGVSLFTNKAKYEANYGQFFDRNNVVVKTHNDDGFNYTSPIKSYNANSFTLYDMAGNVSEWVLDTFNIEIFLNEIAALISLQIPDEIGVTFKKISDRPLFYEKLTVKKIDSLSKRNIIDELMTFSPDWNKIEDVITDPFILEELKSIYIKAESDFMLIKETQYPGIVKGGSWDSSPIYLMSSIKQIFPQSRSSSKIGFRISLDIEEDLFIRLLEAMPNVYTK